MSGKTHNVVVTPRGNVSEALVFESVDSITLIDDQSHGPAAIGRNLETGEVRLIVASPAVVTVRIEAA